MARDKCLNLVVAEPDYALYVASSCRLMALLREVSPVVEQYSIDEAWVDMTGMAGLYGPPVLAAQHLKPDFKDTQLHGQHRRFLQQAAGQDGGRARKAEERSSALSAGAFKGSSGRCRSESFFMVRARDNAEASSDGIRTIGTLKRGSAFLIESSESRAAYSGSLQTVRTRRRRAHPRPTRATATP